ncbi:MULTISPECIES: hypothetical protein [Leptolyngbya]|nr:MULTISPECIES: hypothetical protein [Leptolyngbya]
MIDHSQTMIDLSRSTSNESQTTIVDSTIANHPKMLKKFIRALRE